MTNIDCNCNWIPGTFTILGSTDHALRQDHGACCDITIAEDFFSIIYISYTDIELLKLDRLTHAYEVI